MIAIIIKTTPNRKSLKWLLNSIDLSIPENRYRIYLADEEPLDEWKKPIYSTLVNNGHYVNIYKNRTSVTLARNQLINELLNEDFVLRVDDDFELGGEFKLNSLLDVLSHPNIHFCTDIERQIGDGRTKSGSLRISNGFIQTTRYTQPIINMLSDNEWRYCVINNTRYAYADYMRNLILIKRECFDYVKWNEDLFFAGEHLDFYLRLNKMGFQGAFTPDSIHLHREDIKRGTINHQAENRWRRKDQNTTKRTVFENDWNGYPIFKSSLKSKLYNCTRIFKL